MSVKHVSSQQELDGMISQPKLTVVDFFATWCGPCLHVAPEFERLAKANPLSNFCKVDVDEQGEIAQKFSVTAMPTFMLFKAGEQLETIQGADSKRLAEAVKRHAGLPTAGGRRLGAGPAPGEPAPQAQSLPQAGAAGGSDDESEMKRALFMSMCEGATNEQADIFLAQAGGDVDAAAAMFMSMRDVLGAQRAAPTTSTAKPQPKKSNQYFVGGGDSSGQAVLSPNAEAEQENSGKQDLVSDIFSKARDNGAINPNEDPEAQSFQGSGRRLGHLEGPSPVMQPVRRAERKVRLIFYRNGFRVDHGPLRSLEDDAGREFLDAINRGRVPREVSELYPNTDISVELVDHGEENYAPPAYRAFSGSGHTMAAGDGSQAQASTGLADTQAPSESFAFNPDEEGCSVQLQMLDGSHQAVKVNPKRHTMNDLLGIAVKATKGGSGMKLGLVVRDFPPRPVKDFTETIADAKCCNSLVLVKKL